MTFEDFKIIFLALNYDPLKHNVNLTCHFFIDDEFIATSITND